MLRDNEVQRWNLDGSPADFRFDDSAEAIDFDDEQFSITLTQSKTGILVHLSTGRYSVWALNGAKLAAGLALDAKVIEVAPKSANVYSIDPQGRINLYVRSQQKPILLPFRARRGVRTLHISPDEGILVLVYEEGSIDVLNRTEHKISSFPLACREATALTKNGQVLISVGCGKVRFLNIETKEETVREHEALALVKGLTVDLEGNFAVTHVRDDRINWFNDLGSPATESLMGVEDPAIALSPKGEWIATAGYLDGTVRLFDLTSRSIRFSAKDAVTDVSTLDLCPDRPELYWATQHGQMMQLGYFESAQSPTVWTGGNEYIETVKCLLGVGVVSLDRGGTVVYWESPRKGKILFEAGALLHSTIAVARSSRKVYIATEKGILGWDLSGGVNSLPTIVNPLRNSTWWQMVVGDSDRMIVLGNNEGSIVGVDINNGLLKLGPRKILWSNTWTLSADVADKGFALGGAGTEVIVLTWSGNIRSSFRTDRFIFATDAALDTSAGLIVVPNMSGELLVHDLEGNPVGPPIRNVGQNQFVFARLSPDGYLFSGGLAFGVFMHDLNATRLLRTACRFLASRQISDEGEYKKLSSMAMNKCAARFHETATISEAANGSPTIVSIPRMRAIEK